MHVSALLYHLLYDEHLLIQYSTHQKEKLRTEPFLPHILEQFPGKKKYHLHLRNFFTPLHFLPRKNAEKG